MEKIIYACLLVAKSLKPDLTFRYFLIDHVMFAPTTIELPTLSSHVHIPVQGHCVKGNLPSKQRLYLRRASDIYTPDTLQLHSNCTGK